MATEQVMFRVPPEIKKWIAARARKERRTQTAVWLAALDKYRKEVEGGVSRDA